MSGIKIINVLKDDSFPEILELFRKATASEVIFVLPKKSVVFRREDHFAAFASEATTTGKSISILCNNPEVNELAKKYSFAVMSAAGKSSTNKETALVSKLMSDDVDIQDFNDSVTQDDDDVVVPADQVTMAEPNKEAEGSELAPGMHVVDEVESINEDKNDQLDKSSGDELSANGDFVSTKNRRLHAELATSIVDGVHLVPPMKNVTVKGRAEKPVRVPLERPTDLDYIDAVWREKASQITSPQRSNFKVHSTLRPWWKFWRRPSISTPLLATSTGISKKIAIGILGGSIVLLVAIIYLISGSANISLRPVAEELDTEIKVQTSDVFSSVDSSFGKIPGQLFEITKTGTRESSATGQRDIASKARGKITIYNELSSSPQQLIATTRFESKDGLIFRTLQSVVVPGSSVQDGKIVAGSITVDIIADKPGSQYNIEAGKFTIPAFKEHNDTERYTKIYGQSSDDFTGGANGPSKVVTQADYDAAKEAAVKAAKDQIISAFKEQSSDLTLLDGVEPIISSVKSTSNPDDAAESFSVTVTATLKTVAFRQSDLYRLIKETISRNERLDSFPDKLELSYSDISFKAELGTLAFTVGVIGNGYMSVDVQTIAQELSGKNSEGFRAYFKDKEGIKSATLSLSPFWVRHIPKDIAHIEIELDYSPTTR